MLASVADRSYPLYRPVYIYYTIDNEKSDLSPTRGDPRVKEFLRYILSAEGQQAVLREGQGYLPMLAPFARKELEKLEK